MESYTVLGHWPVTSFTPVEARDVTSSTPLIELSSKPIYTLYGSRQKTRYFIYTLQYIVLYEAHHSNHTLAI